MASGSNKPWSADRELLDEITILKRLFIESGARENPYAMRTALKYLFMVCEPKILKFNPGEIEKRLKWVEEKGLPSVQWFIDGKMVETDSTRSNKKIVIEWLEETFRMLLNKLQMAGIYSRSTPDVKEAMGDFSDN